MVLNKCNKCGGLHYGVPKQTTGDFACTCIIQHKTDTYVCVDYGKTDTPLLSDPLIVNYYDMIWNKIWDNIL